MEMLEITLEPNMFKEWLKKSTPRPILLIGSKETADQYAWFWYTAKILEIAGYWNPKKHGAYAFLGVNPIWWQDKLYHVPDEHYIVEEDLHPDRGRRTLRCMAEQAVETALAHDEVDMRYAWVDDPNNILRIACESIHFADMKAECKIAKVRAALDDKSRYSFFGGAGV